MITNYGALSMLLNDGAVKLDYGAPPINYRDQNLVIEFHKSTYGAPFMSKLGAL